VLGDSQSGRKSRLQFLSLIEHLDVILSARELCESVYAQEPGNAGMAVLAGRFTSTDRIEYLDKA
jgi:ATP-dependent DNA helicase RecG